MNNKYLALFGIAIAMSFVSRAQTQVADADDQQVNAFWEGDSDAKLLLSIDGSEPAEYTLNDLNTKFNKLSKGSSYIIEVNESVHMEGIETAIQINGVSVDVCSRKIALYGKDHASYTIVPSDEDLQIRLLALRPGETETRQFTLTESNNLRSILKTINCNHVVELTLSGKGYDEDFDAIRYEMPFLSTLNLGDYNAENNTIPENALSYMVDITNLVLPENVESIGEIAFYADFLTHITLPASVNKIGNGAFLETDDCLQVVFSKALTPPQIDYQTFGDLSTKTLYVLPGLKEVYSNSPIWSEFGTILEDENPELETKSVVINGVIYKTYPHYASVIGTEIESLPKELEIESSITLDGRTYPVTKIEDDAFYMNKKIEKLVLPESVNELGHLSFAAMQSLKEVTINGPVKILPMDLFFECINLESIKLPETLEVIDQYALGAVYRLKELNLPASLQYILWNGIFGTYELEKINFTGTNDNFHLINGTLYTKDMQFMICHENANTDIVDIIIPEGVTQLYWSPFYGSHIRSITLPSSLEGLPPQLFVLPYRSPVTLDKLTISDNIFEIPHGCFTLPRHLTLGKNVGMVSLNQCGVEGDYHIYCKNLVPFNAADLVLEDPEAWDRDDYDFADYYFYTSEITPNVGFDYNKWLNDIYRKEDEDFYHLMVPGGVLATSFGWKESQIQEMWCYLLDKDKGIVLIQSNFPGISIEEVKINGETVSGKNGRFEIYFDNPEDLNTMEVDVVYRLNDVENMSTHYTAEFNTNLPSTSVAGAELPAEDYDGQITVFDLMGNLIFKGQAADFSNAAKGVYIIKSSKATKKFILK